MIEIRQGDTADITIPIKNLDGSPVDLVELMGFAIFLYDEKFQIVKRYSLSPLTGFLNTLTIANAAINHVRLIIEASHSKQFAGIISYQFRAQGGNTDYENNKWSASTPIIQLLKVVPAAGGQFANV